MRERESGSNEQLMASLYEGKRTGIMPHKTMASLFHKTMASPQKGFLGQNSGMYSASVSSTTDDLWLPRSFFGPMTGSENHFPVDLQLINRLSYLQQIVGSTEMFGERERRRQL